MMNMERATIEQKLKCVFDYQFFENNSRLSAMLSDAFSRYDFSDEGELTDDEAGLLNAAGTLVSDPGKYKGKKHL